MKSNAFQFPLGIISIALIEWKDGVVEVYYCDFQFPLGIISIALVSWDAEKR